jgi:2-methylisocitrate lyase-like PEP mutase family enzyme
MTELLRALHRTGEPLILPNAWDVASARVLADAGFAAIATASAAVTASLGYEDHEKAPADEMFAAAGRIARAVEVPVTVDAEAGYGLAPAELADRLRDAAAAGCNFEDTVYPNEILADVEKHAGRIAALRDADADLVINARVDVFAPHALPGATEEERIEEAVTRGRAYMESGADCLYPILAMDEATIATLVERLPGPVNILYRPGAPSLARLGELGVARVTFGPGLHRATLRHLGELAETIRSGRAPY